MIASLALQTFYSKCEGVHSVPATPIVAAVCGLVNIIMTLLSVMCIGMTTGGFVKLREVLTSYKFGMSEPPDSLCNERLVSRLQHWVSDSCHMTQKLGGE